MPPEPKPFEVDLIVTVRGFRPLPVSAATANQAVEIAESVLEDIRLDAELGGALAALFDLAAEHGLTLDIRAGNARLGFVPSPIRQELDVEYEPAVKSRKKT